MQIIAETFDSYVYFYEKAKEMFPDENSQTCNLIASIWFDYKFISKEKLLKIQKRILKEPETSKFENFYVFIKQLFYTVTDCIDCNIFRDLPPCKDGQFYFKIFIKSILIDLNEL